MTDEQPEKGTKENPLTRDDVLERIKKNGGTAKGLDLSKMVFEEGIDLRGLNNNHLQGITLDNARFPLSLRRDAPLRGAKLMGVHLEEAHLRSTHLEEADLSDTFLESANLGGTHLEGANLSGAHLGSAYLGSAHLQGAILQSTEFSANTGLENVDWGNYILGEEKQLGLDIAADAYRRLKVWYTNAGIHDTAAIFYFREKEAIRKSLKWWGLRNLLHRLKLEASYWVFGHGERWMRLLFGWIVGVILVLALIYFIIGSVWEWGAFLNALYFSAVSFTALGYGEWVILGNSLTSDIVRGLGAFESLVGISMMALLLVTFVRQWTR